MSNLRDQILGARDIASERVTVPEWNVELEIHGMTGTERAAFLDSQSDGDGRVDVAKSQAALIIATAYDPATSLHVFEAADRDALTGKSAAALERVSKVAFRLAGLGTGAEKNDSGASGSSGTASPNPPDAL